jgi:hypothetical protein
MFRLIGPLILVLFVLRVVAQVVGTYPDYFPPNFDSEFLLGRDSEFYGSYQWAFHVHVISGPLALLLGLCLLSSGIRKRWPSWHRRVGRFQCVLLLTCVAPSGFWMAFYAHSGRFAEAGFVALSLATAVTTIMGWQAALRRHFVAHQRWMTRNFLLLFSAVILRIIGGASEYCGWHYDWIYPLNAWLSWLLPIGIYEVMRHMSSISSNGSRGDVLSAMPSRK